MTVTKIHLIMIIKPYIGLLNLKYTCFRICLGFFFNEWATLGKRG